MTAFPIIAGMADAPPKARRKTITVTVNERLMDALDRVAAENGRNRSEMFDRLIEEYLHRNPPPPAAPPARHSRH